MKSRPKNHFHLTYPQLLTYFVLANLLVLDFFIIKSLTSQTSVLGESTSVNNICPQSCLDKFTQYNSLNSNSAKEVYIPLGTGSGFMDDWTDITGAGAYVDSTQYRKIKKITFEATVQVPNGNQTVWVRLFNATDKHPVWYSEVSMDGAGPTALISSPINFDPGNKYYQVQLKTQLRFPANLTQSRIHILTN